jgi:hypothetical protein
MVIAIKMYCSNSVSFSPINAERYGKIAFELQSVAFYAYMQRPLIIICVLVCIAIIVGMVLESMHFIGASTQNFLGFFSGSLQYGITRTNG